MKKKINLNVTVFLLIIFTISLLNIVDASNQGVEELENRTSSIMPEFSKHKLFSGEFFREYDDYFSDTFAFRYFFIQTSKRIKDMKGINSGDSVEIVPTEGINVGDVLVEDNEESNEGSSQLSDFQGSKNDDYINKENINETLLEKTDFGKILVVNDTAMEIHFFNEDASIKYAYSINFLQSKIKKDVKVYSMLVPTQIEFIAKKKYKDISYSQKENIEFINSHFNENVTSIDVYSMLEKNKDKYLYFRTDHHWTALGAYYAYHSFIDQIGGIPVSLDKYEASTRNNFLGTTYRVTLKENLKNRPDSIKYYIPFTEHKFWVYQPDPILKGSAVSEEYIGDYSPYGLFLGGDYPLGLIETNLNNGKKIVIVKDSYANAFIPFLIPHYEEIYIIDPRMYKGDFTKLIEDKGIQEVLVLNYALISRDASFANLITNLVLDNGN